MVWSVVSCSSARAIAAVCIAALVSGPIVSSAGSEGVRVPPIVQGATFAPPAEAAYPPALDLIAVTQGDDTTANGGDVLRLRAGAEAVLDLSWVAGSAVRRGLIARVEIANAWCSESEQFPVDAEHWAFGGEYSARVAIRVPPFSVVGPCALCVSLSQPGNMGGATEVGRYPCWIEPTVFDSSIEKSVIREKAGEGAVALGVACRLFPGTPVAVSLRGSAAPPIGGVAIVSCMRFSAEARQGDPVLEIDLVNEDNGTSGKAIVKAGVDTALGEIDAPRPGVAQTGSAEVVDSVPYTGVSWKGKTIGLRRYIGRIALTRAVTPTQIVLRPLTASGAVDVFEVIGLPASRAGQ